MKLYIVPSYLTETNVRGTVLKATVKGKDNEWFKQIPEY